MVRNYYVRRDVDTVSESQIKLPELESKLVVHSRINYYYYYYLLETIKCYIMQYRGGGANRQKKCYEGVLFNIISVTRGGWVSNLQKKVL